MSSKAYTLKVGDTIKCSNNDEAVLLMKELQKENILADLVYKRNGITGIWLVITSVV